jgi:hypothetical protein
LTDSLDEAGSAFFSTPVNIQAFTTDFGFQNMDTETGGFTFTIQNDNPNALGKDGGSLGYSGIKNSMALKLDYNDGEGVNSTGLYIICVTENGKIHCRAGGARARISWMTIMSSQARPCGATNRTGRTI